MDSAQAPEYSKAVRVKFPYFASSVEVLFILREMVQGQERVAIAGGPVADPVALPKQTSLPDDVTALHGVLQVLLLLKDLGREKAKRC